MNGIAKCLYCDQSNVSNLSACRYCGAPLHEESKNPEREKYSPFYYNGFMLWPEMDFMRKTSIIHFWAGDTFLQSIEIPHDDISRWVDEGTDPTYLFWDLFLLAQGEIDVLHLKEKNTKRPVMFEVRVIRDEYAYEDYRKDYAETLCVR